MDDPIAALRRFLRGLWRVVTYATLKTRSGPRPRPAFRHSSGVVFAAAQPRHLEGILVAYERAFGRPPQTALLARLVRFFPQICWVALDGESIVAFALCGLEPRTFLPPRQRLRSAFLATIGVAEGFRGRGIARALVEMLMDIALKDLGLTEFSLEVEESNSAAIALYRSIEFVRVEGMPGDQPNSFFMARSLKPSGGPSLG